MMIIQFAQKLLCTLAMKIKLSFFYCTYISAFVSKTAAFHGE